MDEITKTQRRTAGYWFSDGIAELVGGVALALVGVSLWLSVARNNDPLATVGLFIMMIGFPLSAKVVRWAKNRVTHERTGYVKFPERSSKQRGIGAVVALVLGVAIALTAVSLRNPDFSGLFGYGMTAVFAGVLGVAFGVRAYQMAMPRFYLSGLVVLVSAGWAVSQELSFIGAMGVMWLALGLTSIVTGTVALTAYLRENPRVGGETA